MLRSGRKEGKPVSAGHLGFRWIDLGGSVLIPLAVVGALAHAALRIARKA